jgi:aspartyl-tRNA synthetase
MKFHELNDLVQGVGFKVFDDAELVVGIKAEGCAAGAASRPMRSSIS